jgi:predicted DNA-binding antitoxin AbrB/MazE fold protein
MAHFIEAIYEHGVFRPLQPVQIPELEHVSLVVTESGATVDRSHVVDAGADMRHQLEALVTLRAKMEALPPAAPEDGLGGADHDRILYGR